MTSPNECSPQRSLACSGALLFSIGLFTGIWTSLALTGAVVVKIPHLALATHLNALLGGLWLLAYRTRFSFCDTTKNSSEGSPISQRFPPGRIGSSRSSPPSWESTGLSSTQDTTNNIIGLLLKFIVVFPSFFAAIYWMRGFMRTPTAPKG